VLIEDKASGTQLIQELITEGWDLFLLYGAVVASFHTVCLILAPRPDVRLLPNWADAGPLRQGLFRGKTEPFRPRRDAVLNGRQRPCLACRGIKL
jgi:hypothetical protein